MNLHRLAHLFGFNDRVKETWVGKDGRLIRAERCSTCLEMHPLSAHYADPPASEGDPSRWPHDLRELAGEANGRS